jgi:hypothetical protein
MVQFQCPRCASKFDTKQNYTIHTDKKNICKIKLQDVIPMSDNFIKLDGVFSCEYCDKEYTYKSDYTKHHKSCKEKNNKEQALREQVDILQEQLKNLTANGVTNNNTTNNNTNNNITFDNSTTNNNNNNTVNNTINVFVNDFKNTKYDYITPTQRVGFMGRNMNAIPKLLEEVHFNPEHPENHNMYMSNYKNKVARYKDRGKWFTKSGSEFVEDLIVDYHTKMFLEFEENPDNPKGAEAFKKYMKITEPQEAQDKIKEQIYEMMYNNRDMITNTDKKNKE